MKYTFHIIVSGDVQGVGYRKFTLAKAQELGIKGSVRNLADFNVEIYATGELEILQAFIALLKIGPERARVQNVQAQNIKPMTFHQFSILRD